MMIFAHILVKNDIKQSTLNLLLFNSRNWERKRSLSPLSITLTTWLVSRLARTSEEPGEATTDPCKTPPLPKTTHSKNLKFHFGNNFGCKNIQI